MYKIGFTSVTFRKKSREEVCKIAKENSICNIEWGADVHLPPRDESALEEVLRLQNEYGINAVSYGSYYRLGMQDISLWRQIVETANAVGAKIIRIWQGSVSSEKVSDSALESMINEARILADIACEYDITIAFEFHKNTNNDCAKSAIHFLKMVNKDNVKTYWQPFAVKEDIENLKAVLPYLIAVHVFSWNKNERRFSLKRKEKIWLEYIHVIKNAKVSPIFIMEFVKKDSEKQFAKDAAVLKRWVN